MPHPLYESEIWRKCINIISFGWARRYRGWHFYMEMTENWLHVSHQAQAIYFFTISTGLQK